MIPAVVRLLNGMLALKTDVNVRTICKVKLREKKIIFCWHLESAAKKRWIRICIRNAMYGSIKRSVPKSKNVTDPEHWILYVNYEFLCVLVHHETSPGKTEISLEIFVFFRSTCVVNSDIHIIYGTIKY
jgi:hypothetical protein